MPQDKYSAVWLSHSSISDYLKCPRLYYLRNIYKDPKTGHKITITKPALALGQVVHQVVEELSTLAVEERVVASMLEKYEKAWIKISGKMGGFKTIEEETKYKERGKAMIKKIMENPGPLLKKAVKIAQDLPHYWLSEEDNIILCGKIDWLEYQDDGSVHIIDFKTGKQDEDGGSLQLPIYVLLATNCQTHPVTKASYWYVEREMAPKEMTLPDIKESYDKVYDIAKKIALARKLEHLKCKNPTTCNHCGPLESILRGEGEFVGESEYHQDIYIL